MRRLRLRPETGFTLIEMMVALLLGIIVSAATLAIVITSVHLSSNYNDRVDATQQGRVAMLKITQALESSCVAVGVAPILAASDSNDVWFYSALSDSPTIAPNKLEISLTGGSLVMNTYAYVSGAAPNWVFASTPTAFTLVVNAQPVSSTPVFQYYGYGANGVLSGTPYTITTNLGSNAATTDEVAINFQANPTDNWTALGRAASLSDAVVLRLASASGATGAANLPCT
ncbi:MAG: prepilin-type N-terminal cleavage/methylation domain-containing protein [Solirubrobacteraceae bacterium]